MERDAFHVSYLLDKIPEDVFHGQAVKTVAYLRVSTAQQDLRSQRLAILEFATLDWVSGFNDQPLLASDR